MAMKDYLRRIFSFRSPLLLFILVVGIFLSFAFVVISWPNVELGLEMVIPYAFLIFYFCTFLSVFQTVFKPSNLVSYEQKEGNHRPNPRIILIIAIFAVIFFMSERFFRFTLPTGGDTPIYVAEINNVARNGVTLDWLTRMPATRRFVLLLYPFIALNLLGEIIIKFVPPLLGVLYVLATYSFVKDFDKTTAALSSLVAAISCNTLVLSSQLYSNFFAITMMTIFFKYYLKSLASNSKKHIALASILQFILLQMYSPAWLVSAGIIFFFLLFSLRERSKRRHVTTVTLKIYFSSIAVICLGPLIISRFINRLWDYDKLFMYYVGQMGSSLSNALSFLPTVLQGNSNRGPYDLHPFLLENGLLLFLASIGVVVLLTSEKSDFRKLVLAGTLALSIAMPFFPIRFRFTVYYPIPILAALTLHDLIGKTPKILSTFNEVRFLGIKRQFGPLKKKMLFLFSIFSVLSMLATFRLYQSPLIYSSADHYADELFWIRDNYDLRTTIICVGQYVHNPPIIYDSDVAWVQGVTRAYIYVGNLSDLLLGNIHKVDEPWVNTPDKINPTDLEHFTILLLWRKNFPEFYVPSEFEKTIIEKVHENVYVVKK